MKLQHQLRIKSIVNRLRTANTRTIDQAEAASGNDARLLYPTAYAFALSEMLDAAEQLETILASYAKEAADE